MTEQDVATGEWVVETWRDGRRGRWGQVLYRTTARVRVLWTGWYEAGITIRVSPSPRRSTAIGAASLERLTEAEAAQCEALMWGGGA